MESHECCEARVLIVILRLRYDNSTAGRQECDVNKDHVTDP